MTLTINTDEHITAVTKMPDKIKYYKNEIVFVKITPNEGYTLDSNNSTFTPSNINFLKIITNRNTLLVLMMGNIVINLVSIETEPPKT